MQSPEGDSRSRLAPILQKLRGADEDLREAAADELDAMSREGLTLAEGLEALDAATDRFPPRRFAIQDSASDLIRAAAQHPRVEYIAVVARLYRKYNSKARNAALELLAHIDDREAALGLMAIVRSNARQNRVRSLPTPFLVERGKHVDVFLPELFEFLEVPDLTWPICELCLGWIERGAISGADMAHHVGRVLSVYAPRRDRILELEQRPTHSEEEFGRLRRETGLLLDLLGNLPTPGVQAELKRALGYRDVRLKYFAVVSLLRLGRMVPPDVIHEVAASPEMRSWLWEELDRQGRSAMFPEAFRTREALAESELVRWLAFPAELGRVPDEIEHMAVVSIEPVRGVVLDFHVYRFRLGEPHWAAKEGWLAGVAGPYVRGAPPGTAALAEASSRFEAWSRRTPEGHVGDLDRLLVEWRERWLSRP